MDEAEERILIRDEAEFASNAAIVADRRPKQAHVAQLVEHVLGKDEVFGSIPNVSSRAEVDRQQSTVNSDGQ